MKLSKCCFWVDLRTGGIIIGLLGLVGSALRVMRLNLWLNLSLSLSFSRLLILYANRELEISFSIVGGMYIEH